MQMRFEEGELARVAVSTNPRYQGVIVTIVKVGPFKQYDVVRIGETRMLMLANDCDYVVNAEGDMKLAFDYQLAKLNPPAEEEALVKEEEWEA